MTWFGVLVLIGPPLAVATFFGLMTFRRMTPLVFHCRRCGRDFLRPATRRFPRACRRCGARDWNTAGNE